MSLVTKYTTLITLVCFGSRFVLATVHADSFIRKEMCHSVLADTAVTHTSVAYTETPFLEINTNSFANAWFGLGSTKDMRQ